jgi:hypothetical protein
MMFWRPKISIFVGLGIENVGYNFLIFFPKGISDIIPHRLLLQAGRNTTMITRHHHNYFPTLSLEHPSLSLENVVKFNSHLKYFTNT